MAIDREATLRNAEKFLRVGRLDAAIVEYARVVEDQPRDWSTANTLGDLYLRAGLPDKAVALYRRIADHLLTEGFFPKAGALLKKVLKIAPDDEVALGHLGDIAARQGLLAEARGHFTAIAARRRDRGDHAGADELVIKLGALDPADLDARRAAAQAIERRGDVAAAAAQYRELYDEFTVKGRPEDAARVLAAYERCQPGDVDPALVLPLLAIALEAGELDAARARVRAVLSVGAAGRDNLLSLGWSLLDSRPEIATWCVDAAVDAAIEAGDYEAAAAVLEDLAARAPHNVAALLRLVEVSVDGGLHPTMYAAQARLADAYLAEGRAEEARVIAEDLVIQDGGDAHVARLRRALEMLGIPDADEIVIERVRMSTLETADAFPAADLTASVDQPVQPTAGAAAEATQGAAEEPQAGITALEDHVPQTVPAATEAPPALADTPAERGAATPQVVEIDLTGLIGELRTSPEAVSAETRPEAEDLDQVFAGLRKEAVTEEADEAGDYVDLARTYLEMGLAEEAIGSLLTAARSPRWRFAAASMLASLYRDSGDVTQAVEWYERAAEAPAPTTDAGRGLLYDLGDLLETLGESARALAVFLELDSDQPGFRDVSARVARLSRIDGGG